MKKNYLHKLGLLFIYILSTTTINSQSSGDIAFIAFNADSNDEFAFVALTDIPANTSIWFTDNEWDGIDSFNNTGEGEIEWKHTAILPAGSIVVIAGNAGSAATLISGLGTVSGSDMNFNTANETLYALLSEPLATTMSSPGFLAGFSNDLSGDGVGNLTNTGLTVGTNFIDFDNDNDGFKYIGDKSSQVNFSDYLPLIMNKNSWQVETSNGTNILPIDGTSFITDGTVLSNNDFNLNITDLTIYSSNDYLNINGIKKETIEIITVYNIVGQQVLNSTFEVKTISISDLKTGIYIVQVKTTNGLLNKKILIL